MIMQHDVRFYRFVSLNKDYSLCSPIGGARHWFNSDSGHGRHICFCFVFFHLSSAHFIKLHTPISANMLRVIQLGSDLIAGYKMAKLNTFFGGSTGYILWLFFFFQIFTFTTAIGIAHMKEPRVSYGVLCEIIRLQSTWLYSIAYCQPKVRA